MDQYIGEVRWFAFDAVPEAWAPCDGKALPIMEHQALFSLIGTKFGGDGRTTFALPKVAANAGVNAWIALEGVYPQRR